MTRPARDGCWGCAHSLRSVHGLHGYFCRLVQDYRKSGCPSKKRSELKPTDQMAFWSVKRLANEFGMSRTAVGKVLASIGAKRWSGTSSRVWYWDLQEVEA